MAAIKSPILISSLIVITTMVSPVSADDSSWCPNRGSTSEINCASDTTVPVITVHAADKAGSFYSDEFTIRGTITSPCLQSAGIYEAETEISRIPVSERSRRASQDFEVTIDAAQEPEIRAVSRSGRTQVLKIDVLDIRG